jgi:uncharacterized membrane protein
MAQRNSNSSNNTRIYVVLLIVSTVIWVFHIYHIWTHWLLLPDQIPIHYDLYSNPDGWGAKKSMVLLPLIHAGLIVVLGSISFISASTFVKFSNKKSLQTPQQVHYSKLLLLSLLIIISLLFIGISHNSISIALNKYNPFKNSSLWLLALVFLSLAIHLFIIKRAKNADDNL